MDNFEKKNHLAPHSIAFFLKFPYFPFFLHLSLDVPINIRYCTFNLVQSCIRVIKYFWCPHCRFPLRYLYISLKLTKYLTKYCFNSCSMLMSLVFFFFAFPNVTITSIFHEYLSLKKLYSRYSLTSQVFFSYNAHSLLCATKSYHFSGTCYALVPCLSKGKL